MDRDLALLALDTAKQSGASYADVRILRQLRQNISSEDERIAGISDTDSIGFGVRVIADGAWGFAGSGILTRDEVQRVAKHAVAIAKASATVMKAPVHLVPEEAHKLSFKTPYKIDPFDVGVEEKTGLLIEINQRLLKNPGIKKAFGNMTMRKDIKLFMNTDGSDMESEVVTTGVTYQATAVGNNDAKDRTYDPPARTMGYENINAQDLLDNTERVAAQAVEHLAAKECPEGRMDLILDPLHLALTMHESVGHPTELDRVLGFEESLAGRSFVTTEKMGNFQYGSENVTFEANNTLEHGLATHGFDDDGVPNKKWKIIDEGIFVGYGTSREVAGEVGYERSTGTCRADHWGSIPIVRIPNLSLMPGKKPLTLEEMISDTKHGIYIEGMGSFSIDQMRCNFQFGGDAFWEIKDGKLAGMLKNVTYQSITPEFWGSCDAVADERFWVPNGVMNCGKGDPGQTSQMTHGASPARFRNIKVGAARI